MTNELADLCEGCDNKIESIIFACKRYMYPARQHTRIGGCAMDTRKVKEGKPEFKLNPLKASKRN